MKSDKSPPRLTWSLALATYERLDILTQCIDCVLSQSLPPSDIVIVDGSKNWKANRDVIFKKLNDHWLQKVIYVEANVRSAAAQRNQATEACQGDIVFLIDDDTLMYPGCAEEIMRIYEKDVDGQVVAVAGSNVSHSPLENTGKEPELLSSSPGGGKFKHFVRKVLQANVRFVPYEQEFPKHPLPKTISREDDNVVVCPTLPGFSLTMRRSIVVRERFEDRLKRYSADEDTDLTYRASRQGLLLKALNAHLHHVGSPGGRLSVYSTTALSSLNIIYLHYLHSPDRASSYYRLRSYLLRRLLVEGAKDIYYRSPAMPRLRGVWVGLSNLKKLLKRPDSEVNAVFESLQLRLTAT